MQKIDWQKYFIAFVITAVIFGTALFTSNYLNEKRAEEIRSIEENISIDILAVETQFDLLEELSCQDIKENSILSSQLSELAQKLDFAEQQLGTDNEEVIRLKRSYTLLLTKDFLLMKRVAEKCDIQPIFLFYFYSNQGDCKDCIRQGHVLTRLQQEYPRLRIYAFDYNLDLSILPTLRTIYGIENTLPALVSNSEVYYGFRTIEEIEAMVPDLAELKEATSTEEMEALSATTSEGVE